MCHYLGGGLHGRQKRVKAQSESSKSVVNSVLISREMPVFPGFLEIIRVVITKSSNIPESQECYKSLLEMYDDREEDINNCLSMYEHIMRPIASYMGDCGRYDNSDEKELFILQNSLRNRRMTVAYSSMYSMLWNDQQRGKNKMAMHRDIAYCNEIKRCIVLSSFSRNIGKTKFFSNTLKKTKNKIY